MLEEVKANLRISGITQLDELEIQPLIDACKVDLNISGVNQISETDPLIKRAIILYCKAYFGFNDEMEKYSKAYEFLKMSLALAGEYNEVATDG